MKVISEGNWFKPWEEEIACKDKDCKATLLVHESDIIAPDHENAATFKWICPICKTDNYLEALRMPRRIKDALNAKRKAPYRYSER